ncbi:MAG: HypC/HybG/HupF family hydrogenase formation chaperone [Chloroflexi bacterium]|nr:HypC/HybG/HupF family hydrogenase formation chaperone [Chloroflexota bacterium]
MCLAVPARIVALDGDSATADLHGNRVQVSTLLVPDARLDSWVLVHAGFAIETLDEDEAQATFAVLRDLGVDPSGAPGAPGAPGALDAFDAEVDRG